MGAPLQDGCVWVLLCMRDIRGCFSGWGVHVGAFPFQEEQVGTLRGCFDRYDHVAIKIVPHRWSTGSEIRSQQLLVRVLCGSLKPVANVYSPRARKIGEHSVK